MNSQEVMIFHDQIMLMAEQDDTVFVAMKPIINGLKLCWDIEYIKIWLVKEKLGCIYINIPSFDDTQYTICIPLKKLNGYLFSFDPLKLKEDLRKKVEFYQEECFQALYKYWYKPERNVTRQIREMSLLACCECAARMSEISKTNKDKMILKDKTILEGLIKNA